MEFVHKPFCAFSAVIKGFPRALPRPGPHPAVPGQQQGAPVDTSERGASDRLFTSRPRLQPEAPRPFSDCDSNAASFLAHSRRVH